MLRNEKYRGVDLWNRTRKLRNPEGGRIETRQRPESEWVRHELPEIRIVSEEQWMAVQRQIKLVNEKWGAKRIGGFNRTEQSRTYLFSGLLGCGVCGGRITITTGGGKSGKKPAYGCFGHRFRGTCTNDLHIRQANLEQQLIQALTNHVLRPEILEHAVTSFHEKLLERLEEMRKLARNAGPNKQSDDELAKLEREAENIAEAIAANGHRQSPTLLARLAVIETQIERVKDRLIQATIPDETPVSLQALKDFVAKKASDLQSILVGEPLLAKDMLRKHITKLVLTPRRTLGGPVFDVSGDVKLFAGKSNVMLMVPGKGGHVSDTYPISDRAAHGHVPYSVT